MVACPAALFHSSRVSVALMTCVSSIFLYTSYTTLTLNSISCQMTLGGSETPFWGPITANSNFCEEVAMDHSTYTSNSISQLIMFLMA